MDQTATVDRFIEVNKKLFALYDEAQAQAHIDELQSPESRDLARVIWKMELCRRAMAADSAQPRGDGARP